MKYLLVLVICTLSHPDFAQSKTVDYNNIFATSHTYVGIPRADSLYVFGVKKEKWHQWYKFKIPKNTIAIDGNERRIFFLTSRDMIVQEYYNCDEYCQTDTLKLADLNSKVLPKNWIRNIHSTEKDFVYFAHRAMHYVYSNDGWKIRSYSNPFEKTEKKDPKFYLDMPYQKITTYNNEMYLVTQQAQDLRFWIFDPGNILEKAPDLKKRLVPAEKLRVSLPKGVVSFFIYDDAELAWVYKDHIEFYRFDKAKQAWSKAETPDLNFNAVFY